MSRKCSALFVLTLLASTAASAGETKSYTKDGDGRLVECKQIGDLTACRYVERKATYSGPKGVPSQGLNDAAYDAAGNAGGWQACCGGSSPNQPRDCISGGMCTPGGLAPRGNEAGWSNGGNGQGTGSPTHNADGSRRS
jgi:hypothetical protein